MGNILCRENIRKMDPPVPCPSRLCVKIQRKIDQYCHDIRFPPERPVPVYDPDTGLCWCCCDGISDSTAAAINDEAFQPLSELHPGDHILATNGDLGDWTPVAIKAMGSLQAHYGESLAAQITVTLPDGSNVMLTLPGEALLINAEGRLHPAGRLLAGDRLRTVDGKTASVLASSMVDADVRHVHLGQIDLAAPLDGHLFNLAGLVCADLAVGVAAFLGQLPMDLIAPLPPLPVSPQVFHPTPSTQR